MKRRQFIGQYLKGNFYLASTAIAAGHSYLFSPNAIADTKQDLYWQDLSEHCWLVQHPDFNLVVINTNDGLIMVDGGSAEYSEALISELNRRFQKNLPKILFNTHWHYNQTGSNDILGKNNATIIAHENTRLWLSTEINSQWEDKKYSAKDEYARPNKTFYYDTKNLQFGGLKIEYGYLPQAHTDGDIYVNFPTEKLFIGGGVLAGNKYPILDYSSNGWLGGMIDALTLIIDKVDSDTIIIPESGNPIKINDVKKQLSLCEDLMRKIAKNYYSGSTFQDFINSDPLNGKKHYQNSPELFLSTTYQSAWWHLRELRRWLRA